MSKVTEQLSEDEWVAIEREKVISYLVQQGCEHGGVAEWPAFHLDPYLALWAVQSAKAPGRIGWWVISGDVPTDYMSGSSGYHPRDAMRYLSGQWMQIADCMARGVRHSYMIGRPDQWPTLAPLLRSRAETISRYAEDNELWID